MVAVGGDAGRGGTFNAGGGAGNPGGVGLGNNGWNGGNGTGGLLIVYANRLINNGMIEANGMMGGYGGGASGGSSGGGSVNLFYSTDDSMINPTKVTAKGGDPMYNNDDKHHGGAGGAGSVSYDKITLP